MEEDIKEDTVDTSRCCRFKSSNGVQLQVGWTCGHLQQRNRDRAARGRRVVPVRLDTDWPAVDVPGVDAGSGAGLVGGSR